MKKKTTYLAPEADLFFVQPEAIFCASGDINIAGFGDDGTLESSELLDFDVIEPLF